MPKMGATGSAPDTGTSYPGKYVSQKTNKVKQKNPFGSVNPKGGPGPGTSKSRIGKK